MQRTFGNHLQTHLETRGYSPRQGEIDAIRDRLLPLSGATRDQAFANLKIAISFLVPAEEYHVKAKLRLPGRLLITGEHDSIVFLPFERCISKLMRKIELEQDPTFFRIFDGGMTQSVPVHNELSQLQESVGTNNCRLFVNLLLGYHPAIRRRIQAWVDHHAGPVSSFDSAYLWDDLELEILLSAFERFESRPTALRIGDWLETIVDPSLRSLLGRPNEIAGPESFRRSLWEMRAAACWTRDAVLFEGDGINQS